MEVTAGAILRGGKLLAARRRQGHGRGGLWELPGGKVEPDETPELCLARELREELGVAVEVGPRLAEVVHEYPDITIRLMVFRCALPAGEPRALDHAELRWINPEQVGDLAWSPADAAVIGEVGRRLW